MDDGLLVHGDVVPPGWELTAVSVAREMHETVSWSPALAAVAVLTLPAPVETPFARVLRVEASLPWSLKALRAELARLDVGAVDLRRRGLAGDVEDLRRRLRLRGSRRVTVLLTRVANRPWAVVGVPVEA